MNGYGQNVREPGSGVRTPALSIILTAACLAATLACLHGTRETERRLRQEVTAHSGNFA